MSAEISTKNDTTSAALNNNSASVDVHFNVSSQIKATLKLLDILSNMHKSTGRSIKELANFVANDAVYTVLEESSIIPYQYKIVQTEGGRQTFQSVYNGQLGGTIEEMYASSLKENMDTAWYTPLSEVRRKFLDENGYEQAIVFSGCSEVYNTNYFYILEKNKKDGTVECVSIEFKGDGATAQKLIERLNHRSSEPVASEAKPAIDTPIVYGKENKLTITEFLSLLSDYYTERKQDETTTIRKQEELVGNIDQYKKGIGERIKDVSKLYKMYLSAWSDDLERGIKELCPIAMRLSRGELSVDEALALVGRRRRSVNILVTLRERFVKGLSIYKAGVRSGTEKLVTEHDLPLKKISGKFEINFKALSRKLNPILQALNLGKLSKRNLNSLLKQHPELIKAAAINIKPQSWVVNRAVYLISGRGTERVFRRELAGSKLQSVNQQSATQLPATQHPATSNQLSKEPLQHKVENDNPIRLGNEAALQSATRSQKPENLQLRNQLTANSFQQPDPASRDQLTATCNPQSAMQQHSPARGLLKGALATEARRAVPSEGRVSARSEGTPVTRRSPTTAPRRGATKTLSHRPTEELRIKRELQKMQVAASIQEPLILQHETKHGNPSRGRLGNDNTQTLQPAIRNQLIATSNQPSAINIVPAQRVQQATEGSGARRAVPSEGRVSARSEGTPVTRRSPTTAPRRGARTLSHRATEELRIKRELQKMQVAASIQEPLILQHETKHGNPSRGRLGNDNTRTLQPAIRNQLTATSNQPSAINIVPAKRVQQATSGARRVVPSGNRVSDWSEGTPVQKMQVAASIQDSLKLQHGTKHGSPRGLGNEAVLQPASRDQLTATSNQTSATRNPQPTATLESGNFNNYREILEQEEKVRYQNSLKAKAIRRSKNKLKKRERAIREALEKIRVAAELNQMMMEKPLEHNMDEAKKKSIARDTLIEFLQFLAESFGKPLEIEEWRFSDERSIDIDLFMVLHNLGIDIEQIEPVVEYIKAELSNVQDGPDKQEKFQKLLSLITSVTLKSAM